MASSGNFRKSPSITENMIQTYNPEERLSDQKFKKKFFTFEI